MQSGRDLLHQFWKDPVGANVLRVLEEKAARIPWERDRRTDAFALFSASGFTDELREIAEMRGDVVLVDDSE